MRRASTALIWCCLGWLCLGQGAAIAAQQPHADIRVLIDISGSMKQNDPHNLRRPALRMLVGLLQPGTKAGVWTFAKYAAELVQPGEVGQTWKREALAASKQINSPGLFTNIELVLRRAVRDWEGARPTHRRNLLLLTDGMVDVSKAPGESAASRRRILQELLPKLRDMDVRVHTIALSDRADHELLQRLAHDTDGWYQQVASAEQLQRVFLKLFEQAGQPDGLPLKDNKFLVDNTVREATLLLFHPPDAAEPTLTAPSGQSFGHANAPASATWYRDTGYDLITLHDPEIGEWSLSADTDPDNRVMVVTDLKLQLSELPSRIAVGEALPVTANLTNQGHLITRREFLDLVEVRAESKSDMGLAPQPLNDLGHKGDAQAGDGLYSMNYVEPNPQREVSLVVAAQSPTFLRERRHLLSVLEPATLQVVTDDGGQLVARVSIDDAVMRGDSVNLSVWQQAADASQQPLVLMDQADGGQIAVLQDTTAPVYARLEGVTQLGNHIARELGPVYAPGMAPVVTPPQTAATVATEPPAPADTVPAAPASSEEPVAEPVEQGLDSWVIPTIAFASINLLLMIGGLVYWLLRRRRRGEDEVALVEDEAEAAADAADEAPDAQAQEAVS
jgi:uncharacterized protein (TIGR03503 family)